MRIVFGVRHFKLKEYTLKELGIPNEGNANVTIERRQKYFHLYWIPFFPTGKKWALRKGSELYELPPQYETFLNAKGVDANTSPFAFALPMLVAVGFLIFYVGSSVEKYTSRKRSDANYKTLVATMHEELSNPSICDYYHFQTTKDYSDKYLKVFTVKGDSIQLQLAEDANNWYSHKGAGELACKFSENPNEKSLAWFSKEELKEFINPERRGSNFEGSYLPFNGDSRTYKLMNIYHFQAPKLVDIGIGKIKDHSISLSIVNKGVSTSITEIKNVQGEVFWTDKLPLKIAANETFELHGTFGKVPEYIAQITCKDIENVSYTYQLQGKGIERKLTALK